MRSYLARIGPRKGDLSKFVDTAVRREVLRCTVKDVQAQAALNLSQADLARLARNSFEASFLSNAEKNRYKAEIDVGGLNIRKVFQIW